MEVCMRNTAEKGWKRKKRKKEGKEKKAKKEFFSDLFLFFLFFIFFEGDGFALSFFIFLNEKEYGKVFQSLFP